MNTFLLFIALMISTKNLYALPILNANMAADGTLVTIWPDHEDPDHFYFAPTFFEISKNADDSASFSYMEYRNGRCSGVWQTGERRCRDLALMASTLKAGLNTEQLEQAQNGIRKIRPNARFSPIPFMSSRVEFTTAIDPFLHDYDCEPYAGQILDEVSCSLTLNLKGIQKLKPFLFEGKIIPFKFLYRISGVRQVETSKKFESVYLDYGLAVKFGGKVLANHPDLISE